MNTKSKKSKLRRTKRQQPASRTQLAGPTNPRQTCNVAVNFDSEGFFWVLDIQDGGASTYYTGKLKQGGGLVDAIGQWTQLNTVSVAVPLACLGPGVAPETRELAVGLCSAVQAAGMSLSLIHCPRLPDSHPAWEVSARYAALCVLREYLENAALTRLALSYCN